ncbi:MAG: T9SS type A sorting domain-containing protein [bacterium]
MKRFGLFLILLSIGISIGLAQTKYRLVTIKDMQAVSLDSLLLCDQLQNSNQLKWSLQTSKFHNPTHAAVRETVEVVGQVIVPPKVIAFTGSGNTLILRDTSANAGNSIWTNIMCRVGNLADTVGLYNTGFLGLKVGDIIRIRGYVDEYPASQIVSYTQFVPIGGLQLLDEGRPIAKPVPLDLGTFYKGIYPGGSIMWSTGEQYEGACVEFTNLTVTSIVNSLNGTFSMVDAYGNEVAMMDASKWFTLRTYKDPTSMYAAPAVFQKIDTIRGYIMTNSGSETVRGYRIAPLFRGDLVYGKFLPGISTHRRTNVVVDPTDTAKVSVRAFIQTGASGKIAAVLLKKSFNNGSFTADSMKYNPVDSTYVGAIPPQPANTFIKYFIQAYDTAGSYSTYASSAFGSASSDTGKGMFFYTVLNRPLSVTDIQTTPFTNGRTGYLGAVTTVTGIVSADTSDIDLNAAGATPWYIQNSNQPWSGMWITGIDALLRGFKKGDSISVTGTVLETNDVTNIGGVTAAVILGSSKTVPSPVVVQTGNFSVGIGNGNPVAEKWEGMLVRFNNVTVTDIYPTFADQKEYAVSDGSGDVLIRIDGKNMYSNIAGDESLGKTIIKVGDKFSYVQGVVWFAFSRYKIVPRGNSDFGTRTTDVMENPELYRPKVFALEQNYPNPFNPSTTIEYNLPKSSQVALKVFNMLGQEVKTLVNQFQNAGHFSIRFAAQGLPSGVYIYQLHSDVMMLSKRMILLK